MVAAVATAEPMNFLRFIKFFGSIIPDFNKKSVYQFKEIFSKELRKEDKAEPDPLYTSRIN